MKRKNKMDKLSYINGNLELAGATFFFYEPLLLLHYESPIFFLFSLLGLLFIVFINICMNLDNRTGASIFYNTAISYGILTGIIFFNEAQKIILMSVLAGTVSSIIYMIILAVHNKKYLCRWRQYKHAFWRKTRQSSRFNTSIASIALIIVLAVNIFSGEIPISSQTDTTITLEMRRDEDCQSSSINSYSAVESDKNLQEDAEEYSLERVIEDNYGKLKILMYEEWDQADYNARMDALEILLDIIEKELRLNENIQLSTVFMGYFSTVSACYVDEDKTVYINELRLYSDNYEGEGGNQGLRMISTIAHEMFHCFEYRLTSLPDEVLDMESFENIKQYQYELSHYINGDEDLTGYNNQVIEKDANTYGDIKAKQIYDAIKAIYDTEDLHTSLEETC
ncbi:MAG: hypothetical protein K6E47_13075 [Lachnospiraceae bacterium]|nr:hypothetical protein [Lachnospiraceae bacterium]